MCGIGYRTCGICSNAGGCLASMNEDFFCLASKDEVRKRLKDGRYLADKEIMELYIANSSETLQFYENVFRDNN